ncbi:MAG: homocysteine S-methyltransferase family protein [Candidatus Krumholzibacteriota bacterium]|nr:homocysteine S-methyltransferase family protein [Candidatus Krumholzibacteriota bacterium]
MTKRAHGFLETVCRKVVLFDGGMGSMLIAAGLRDGDVPEAWTLERPDEVAAVHAAYLDAGAEVVQTNTFGATRLKLGRSDAGRLLDVDEVNERAAALAREAVGARGGGRFVAGDIGPTGLFFPPVGELTEEAAYAAFREQAAALERGGVDLFLVETMYDVREARAALRAARAVSGRPVVVEATFERKPRGFFTLVGDTPERAVEVLGDADMLGANCTLSSPEMPDLVSRMRELTDLPLLFQPNAGNPEMERGRPVYRQTPAAFADDIVEIIRRGAGAVGGCCGTDPRFIREIHDRLTHGS